MAAVKGDSFGFDEAEAGVMTEVQEFRDCLENSSLIVTGFVPRILFTIIIVFLLEPVLIVALQCLLKHHHF